MIAVGRNPAGDLQINGLIAVAIAGNQFLQQTCPTGAVQTGVQANAGQTIRQPLEMFGEAKQPSVIDGDDFVDTIREQETAVQR